MALFISLYSDEPSNYLINSDRKCVPYLFSLNIVSFEISPSKQSMIIAGSLTKD